MDYILHSRTFSFQSSLINYLPSLESISKEYQAVVASSKRKLRQVHRQYVVLYRIEFIGTMEGLRTQGMNGIGAGLILFSAEGNLAMVEKLLEIEGINVNAVDRTLMTALHWAALKGHMEIVLLLLKKGADLHRNDESQWTPLHWSCDCPHDQIAIFLMDEGACIHSTDRFQRTALHWLASYGRQDLCIAFIDRGAAVNVEDIQQSTPLSLACRGNHVNTVKALLTKGADVHSRDHHQWSPLHWACEGDNSEILMVLLEKGADINARDLWQRTPLHWLCLYGRVEMAIMMIETGADINAIDCQQRTCLHMACAKNYEELAIVLIKLGANIYLLDTDDKTPQCNEEMIALFNRLWCQTSLIRSMHNNDIDEFKKLLNDVDTDVNENIGENSWSLLHAAVYLNQLEYVNLLLDKDRNKKSHRRSCRHAGNRRLDLFARCNPEKLQSALHIACSKGYTDIVRTLGRAISFFVTE